LLVTQGCKKFLFAISVLRSGVQVPHIVTDIVQFAISVLYSSVRVSHIVTDIKLFVAESIHDLVICRLSRQSGYAGGGDEVFLLCEKINKGEL